MEQIQENRVVLALSLKKSPGRAKMQFKKQFKYCSICSCPSLPSAANSARAESGLISLKLDLLC